MIMKKLNKYLFLLVAAVCTFTACEKEVERGASPVAGTDVAAFKASAVEVDINPSKAALEYAVALVRSNTADELAVGIEVVEGDIDIITVPATVTFAKDASEASLLLTFPEAQLDSTYSVVLTIASDNQSPYLNGASTFAFTVNIASWEQAPAPAVFVDGVISPVFDLDPVAWYVPFMEKANADGSKDFRFLNPYRAFDPEAEPDQFGVFSVFPYNAEADVDLTETYNWEMHVDAEGNVTFPRTFIGVDYGYGPMSPWLMADYLAARNETEPDYTANPCGVFDPAAQTITIPDGALLLFMGTSGYYAGEHVIYLDSKAYQNDHLSIDDYNSEAIEWVEVESEVNLFESSIFRFSNEEQKLFKAVDPYEGNDKSPFIDLYCLKDAYAAGGNLAFYWNGEDGGIRVPSMQNTHLAFMQQDLFIAEGSGEVTTSDVKGTEVKVFSFDIVVTAKNGNTVGEFVETFSMANEQIVFSREDFIGAFTLNGTDQFEGTAASIDVEIADEEGTLVLHGIDYCSGLALGFDEATGVLSLAPQKQDSLYGKYDITLYTTVGNNTSTTASIDLAFGLSGVAKSTRTSEADGYLVRSVAAGGWLAGLYDLSLIPSEAAPAPANNLKPAKLKQPQTILPHAVRGSQPTMAHLSFSGKRSRTLRAPRINH